MIFVSKVILLPLKGITLRVTFPKVPRYGIMAISPRYFETLVKIVSTVLPDVYLPLSSRDVAMSHSMSWSWLVRSSRGSFSVESPSIDIVLDEDLASKDVKIDLSQQINTLEKTVGSWSLWYLVSPLSSYLTSLISGWDSCLVGWVVTSLVLVCSGLASHVLHHVYLALNLKWGLIQTLAPNDFT